MRSLLQRNSTFLSIIFSSEFIPSPFKFQSLIHCPNSLLFSSLRKSTMRVHPVSGLGKRNIAIRYHEGIAGRHQKKLRRLPHIFSRVLELPFTADADVAVEEGPTDFRFVASADGIGGEVRAHMIQICPGVIKIVVVDGLDADTGSGSLCADGSDLEFNRWRFRLPQCTRPALATAEYVDGELVVTVPKDVVV